MIPARKRNGACCENSQGVRAQIDLPAPVAVWVLAAHAIALLTPLLLLWAVHANWGYVAARTAVPGLSYVAVALMMAGAAFEIGQNTADRWYLEKGMGSTDSMALADFLFYLCNCLGTLALIAACMGDLWWLMGFSVAVAGAFVFLYLTGREPHKALGILGLVSTIALYLTFGNPIVFLQIVAGQLTLYFFTLLLKTRAQSLHGCVALVSTSGIWAAAWAIFSGAAGKSQTWLFVVAFAAAVALLALALKLRLEQLAATPRPTG